MKLCNITDVDSFFDAVKKCEGDVYLTTPEGDRLNLKSNLTKYVAMTTLFQSSIIEEMDLELTNPADITKMVIFSLVSAD